MLLPSFSRNSSFHLIAFLNLFIPIIKSPRAVPLVGSAIQFFEILSIICSTSRSISIRLILGWDVTILTLGYGTVVPASMAANIKVELTHSIEFVIR